MRYLIQISYDGTGFIGWQKQKTGRSIQAQMEAALREFCQKETAIVAAGRTDARVHALAQFAHFDYEGNMTMPQILKAFRRWLPDDIKVLQIWEVDPGFSARYQAYEREYRYILSIDRNPFDRNYAGFIPHLKIRLEPMQKAAPRLLGRHDFSSFGRLNPEVPNRICEIKEITITEGDDSFVFILRADRFLHNMVRRIVGTLTNVSHFDLEPDAVSDILAQRRSRQTLVTTAPPEGLYLIGVKYPAELLDGKATCKFSDIRKR